VKLLDWWSKSARNEDVSCLGEIPVGFIHKLSDSVSEKCVNRDCKLVNNEKDI